jgi:hypothetical protein
MFIKKSILVATLCILIAFGSYTSSTFGIGEKCLTLNAYGCMKIGEKCLMYCQIIIDSSYRNHGDVPILVVKNHISGNVISIMEMTLVETVDGCDKYEARPEVPCEVPYDIAVYINDISGLPILSESAVVCP